MKKSSVPEWDHGRKRASREQNSPPTNVPQSEQVASIQRARLDPKSLTPGDVLNLQHTMGNHAVGQLLADTGADSGAAKHGVQRAAHEGQAAQVQPPPITQTPAAAGTIQRVLVKKPANVKLTGGNGVSVLWTKSKKSPVPHVTVGHGVVDNKGMVKVTNFHYKTGGNDYFHWDDTNGSTTFVFRGGSPTEGVYTETSRQARKFGVTLQRPANLPAPAPVQAPVQPQAPAPTPAPVFDVDEEEEQESTQVAVAPQQNDKDVPENWWED
jgi:hypothetical protein